MKPTCKTSSSGNLLMWSGLTFGPSFMVKQWFTGFSELSFLWIEIGIGSLMHRSSYIYIFKVTYLGKARSVSLFSNLLNLKGRIRQASL